MTESQNRGVFGRRRRANATPGEKRSKRYPVTVTPTEAAELEAKAAAAGMSVPRLLHESAKSSHVETSTERKAAIVEGYKREGRVVDAVDHGDAAGPQRLDGGGAVRGHGMHHERSSGRGSHRTGDRGRVGGEGLELVVAVA